MVRVIPEIGRLLSAGRSPFGSIGMSGVIETRQGEVFEIALESSPTTGFRWELADPPNPLVQLISDTIDPNMSASGAPAVQRFQFRAEAPGQCELTFHYRRSWEQKPPREIQRFSIHISSS